MAISAQLRCFVAAVAAVLLAVAPPGGGDALPSVGAAKAAGEGGAVCVGDGTGVRGLVAAVVAVGLAVAPLR